MLAAAASAKRKRIPGHAKVLSRNGDKAVLLLTGYVEADTPGGETLRSRAFSGLYEARRGAKGWALARHLPIDADSRIIEQDVRVGIRPGEGLDVTTRAAMSTERAEGLAVRLNRGVILKTVKVNGRPAEHLFSGGLLWARSPARGPVTLELFYRVPAGPSDSTTLAVNPVAGFVRDQEIWLPVLNYRTEADMARIKVRAEIPASHHLSISVPQTETVRDGVRIVEGSNVTPSHGISLLYDRNFAPYEVAVADARMRAFVTPDFKPGRDELESAFGWTYGQLRQRFGPPRTNYFAVGQRRWAPWTGWSLLTNNIIVGGANGGPLRPQTGVHTGAGFGHEMSHAWTMATGPARFLMMEGWATWVEAGLVAAEHGSEAERAFWEAKRNSYEQAAFEGRVGFYTDYNNEGLAYTKGAWVFRMLQDRLGEAVFLRGLRFYIDIPNGRPAGVPELAEAMSRAAGYDVWPILRPWIEEDVTPDIQAFVEGGRLRLVQAGPVFNLPLEVELATPSGPVRRTVALNARQEVIDITDMGAVSAVRLDPERRLLMRRRLGEVVTFEFTAPEASKVQLTGDFAAQPLDAENKSGVWQVSVPLSEGLYHWRWIVDGKSPASGPDAPAARGTRAVRPLETLDTPYPRGRGGRS
jgi:hypothetical protein